MSGAAIPERRKPGLDDPRAVDILTTEHWSLLSARTLGYQEMFGRATIFVAVLSGIIVALALLAQVTRFGRETLAFALLLIAVALFIGIVTFVRCVAINYEDARWIRGMNLLRRAYLEMVPELEQFFVTGHEPDVDRGALRHGLPQHFRNLASSLTTTSGVVAALNSVLAGALVCVLAMLAGTSMVLGATIGVGVSIVSAILHVRYAARFRRSHTPAEPAAGQSLGAVRST
jgi:type III secretory pathway component EscS